MEAPGLCSGIKLQGPEGTCRCYTGGVSPGASPCPCPRAQESHFIPAQGHRSLPTLGAAGHMMFVALCPVLQPPCSLPILLGLLCHARIRLPSAGPTPPGEDPRRLKKPLGKESCCGASRNVLPTYPQQGGLPLATVASRLSKRLLPSEINPSHLKDQFWPLIPLSSLCQVSRFVLLGVHNIAQASTSFPGKTQQPISWFYIPRAGLGLCVECCSPAAAPHQQQLPRFPSQPEPCPHATRQQAAIAELV